MKKGFASDILHRRERFTERYTSTKCTLHCKDVYSKRDLMGIGDSCSTQCDACPGIRGGFRIPGQKSAHTEWNSCPLSPIFRVRKYKNRISSPFNQPFPRYALDVNGVFQALPGDVLHVMPTFEHRHISDTGFLAECWKHNTPATRPKQMRSPMIRAIAFHFPRSSPSNFDSHS
jgi:hypothetical protein